MNVFENINLELLKVLGVNEGCCCYCGRRMNNIKGHYFKATIDHIKPKSNGGGDDVTNRIPCCWQCNQLKAYNSLEYFLIRIEQCLDANIGSSKCSSKRWRHMHATVTQMILLITESKRKSGKILKGQHFITNKK